MKLSTIFFISGLISFGCAGSSGLEEHLAGDIYEPQNTEHYEYYHPIYQPGSEHYSPHDPTWEGEKEPDVWYPVKVSDGHWHTAYIEDNCSRCPECCVVDDRAENEDIHCTPEYCPGLNCLCVLDSEGVWWLDATRAGTDDVE